MKAYLYIWLASIIALATTGIFIAA